MDRVTFKGFAYGAIAAASYGLNPLFALPLYADGMGADSVLFYRYAFGLVMLGVMMVVQRQSFALRRCEVLPDGIAFLFFVAHFVLVLQLHGCGYCLYYLVRLSGIGGYLNGGILQGKNFSDYNDFHSLGVYGYFVALSRRRRTDFEPDRGGIGLPFLAYIRLIYNRCKPFCSERYAYCQVDFLCLVVWFKRICGTSEILSTVISLVTMTKSIHYIGSTPAAILGALEPLTTICCGVLVFGERLTPRIVLGIVFILVAVTLIIMGKALIHQLQVRVIHRSHRFPQH